MKYLLTLITVLISINCFGQISIVGKSIQPVEISKLHGTAHTLYYTSDDIGYYISMSTDNKFDDHINLTLGETKEEALQSLNDLLSLIGTKESVIILNYFEEQITIMPNNFMGVPALFISHEKQSGSSALRRFDLEKAIKKIKSFVENK